MNHWADTRNSVTVLERDHTVFCPKPRRTGLLRNPTTVHHHDRDHHLHPVRSFRCNFSHQVELCGSKAETDILDIILMKDGFGEEQVHTQAIDSSSSPPPFFSGSPPSRVANPLTKDSRFTEDIDMTMVSSPQPLVGGGGRVRDNFGNRPTLRIEGFDCLNRHSRNCSIPALA
ncbi:PREDICTED: uncharacterized protein LOC104800007 [Tarenaya hassleriana]|uniref:uncharacterized protein LOC104800007 n=1 Tax=Tarenaya hassleriana TaxID=28532 RepID=UPI00053CA725|nr:PREDICTED: uncharacterized protein LOC104800007 [Tarenaya hassleriana]